MLGFLSMLGHSPTAGLLPAPPPDPEPQSQTEALIARLLGLYDRPIDRAEHYRDLPREARQSSLGEQLATLGAAVGSARPGEIGTGLAEGVFGMEQLRRRALEEHNAGLVADQEGERRGLLEQLQLSQAQDSLLEERERRRATEGDERSRRQALADLANELDRVLPEGDPRRAEAQAALVAGDFDHLAKLRREIAESGEADEERAALEGWMRSRGLDPADPQALELFEYERKRQLDRRYAPPSSSGSAREGRIMETANGDLVLIDETTGSARPVTLGGEPVRGRGRGDDDLQRAREDALEDTIREERAHDEDVLAEGEFDFDAAYQRNLDRRRRILGGGPDFSNVRSGSSSAPKGRRRPPLHADPRARPPLENGEGAPVSPTGSSVRPDRGGDVSAQANQVLERLPFSLPDRDPATGQSTRALIEGELRKGRSVDEVVQEILALAGRG